MIIKSYIEDYVICSECGKPDTRLVKDDRVMLLRCDACGGHRPVRKRKARTEPVSENLEEGTIMDVEIQSISKRGDGVVKMGRYIMYVANAKPGQKVKIKIYPYFRIDCIYRTGQKSNQTEVIIYFGFNSSPKFLSDPPSIILMENFYQKGITHRGIVKWREALFIFRGPLSAYRSFWRAACMRPG